MSDLGVEEGCPAEEPANLEEIIRRPVKRPQPVAAPTYVFSFSLYYLLIADFLWKFYIWIECCLVQLNEGVSFDAFIILNFTENGL